MSRRRASAPARGARSPEPRARDADRRGAGGGLPGRALRGAGVALAFAGVAWLVFAPALEGPFLSDDQHYVENNPYVHHLGWDTLGQVLRPYGPASRMVENWAPVNVVLHGLAWQAFGDDVRGHHAVQLALHVLATLLLIPVLRRSGFGGGAALGLAALFLVHPANVEVGAWISQLKTTSAFSLALLALLAHPRRPALGTVLFALSLLAKPIAVFALPVAAVRAWVATRPEPETPGGPEAAAAERRAAPWLLGWVAALAGFALVELQVFHTHASGSLDLAAQLGADTRLRSALALVGRYTAMAFTGAGLSTFHDPLPVRTWTDPWLLLGAAALALAGARAAVVLVRRRTEAVFWAWAAAAYAPVSQIFPFPFPLADRYLYFVLPGLFAAVALALRDAARAAAERLRGAEAGRLLRAAGPVALAALALAVGLAALRSHDRAGVWSSQARVLADAAAHYPHGKAAHMLRARQAARMGQTELALAELRPLVAQGYHRFDVLVSDPAYAPVRDDPRFQALLHEMAAWWLRRIEAVDEKTQPDLYMAALCHAVRGENGAALAALDRALALGGPYDEILRDQREALVAMPPGQRSGP